MGHDGIDCDAYLARVGYSGPRVPSLAVLQELVARHTASITFENLEPITGQVPSLDLPSLQQKLVTQRRGGYCYEQNTLFQAVLGAFGFTVTGLLARVRRGMPAGVMTARSHMLLRVDLSEGTYLADVGFGALTPTAALALRADVEQATPNEAFRLRMVGEEHLLQASIDGRWADIYQLALLPQLPSDYAMVNWYTATRPNALFAKNLMVTRPTAGIRRTLFNRQLVVRRRDAPVERRVLRVRDDYEQVLAEEFGLTPSDADMAAIMALMEKHDPDQPHNPFA
jgi:N-hydroxyarylamine O-acetyltransferase